MRGEPPSVRRSVFNESLQKQVCHGTPCVWAGTVMGTGFILDFPLGARKILGPDTAFQLFQQKAGPQTVKGGEKDMGFIRDLYLGRNKDGFL